MSYEVRVSAQSCLDRLAAMEESLKDPRPAFAEIANTFFTQVEPSYLRTAQWVPLAPDSLARKRRKGKPARPLLGGSLEASLKGGRYRVMRINKLSVTVGTRHPLAQIHNAGGRGRRFRAPKRGALALGLRNPEQRVGGLPRRPLISITPADRTTFRRIMARHVMSTEANAYAANLRKLRRGLL